MSTETNFAALWPTLSPRERDAKVAKAKGWSVTTAGAAMWWFDLDGNSYNLDRLPRFSVEWQHVGPLLTELAREFDVELSCGDDGRAVVELTGWQPPHLLHRADSVSLLDAIALAYCLAKGARS